MLISTVAIKPCRPECIKSLIYPALKLPLASIITYCKVHQQPTPTPVTILGSLNRTSVTFMRTRVKAPLFLSRQLAGEKNRQQFKCSPSIFVHYFIVHSSHRVSCQIQGHKAASKTAPHCTRSALLSFSLGENVFLQQPPRLR